ncbi:MAG: response regulator [Ignavibacteriales bacterium]|nr:response regulator [Ignavibacteriales bacterium]
MEHLTILVVEDDPAQRALLLELLSSVSGYTVLEAENVAKALPQIQESRPSLIISDYYMPGEDGFQFCSRVKKHPVWRESMFMLLTAAADLEHKLAGLEIGADDYLAKPFNAEEFISRVRALLRIKTLQDDLRLERDELQRANITLEENFEGIVALLSKLISARVPGAEERGENARRLCQWIGERFNLPQHTLHLLGLAAQLHEIGKITFGDDLLQIDPRKATHLEIQRLSEFAVLGQSLVEGIPQLGAMGLWFKHQLENFDGTGYPDKKMGDQIPLPARILRAVNVVDQLPLDMANNTETLVEALQKMRGIILDPHVVQLTREYFTITQHPAWAPAQVSSCFRRSQ